MRRRTLSSNRAEIPIHLQQKVPDLKIVFLVICVRFNPMQDDWITQVAAEVLARPDGEQKAGDSDGSS